MEESLIVKKFNDFVDSLTAGESIRLYYILSGLRGPDIDTGEMHLMKAEYTTKIRGIMFSSRTEALQDNCADISTLPMEMDEIADLAVKMGTRGKIEHFVYHTLRSVCEIYGLDWETVRSQAKTKLKNKEVTT